MNPLIEELEFRRFLIAAPVLASAVIDNFEQQYTVSWSAVAGAAQYRVAWGVNGFDFPSSDVLVATPTNPFIYLDSNAINGQFAGESRYYRIKAIAANGEVSVPSNVLYNTIPPQISQFGPQPAVDTAEHLTVALGGNSDEVTLQWPALNLNYPGVESESGTGPNNIKNTQM